MTAYKKRIDTLFTENSPEQQRGIEEKAKNFQQSGLIKIHNQLYGMHYLLRWVKYISNTYQKTNKIYQYNLDARGNQHVYSRSHDQPNEELAGKN